MRIIAGRFKGVTLAAPSGAATRPTSDRVREAIFNILQHGLAPFRIEGTRVLDLFAGTGAMALEALSRGAAFALLVDHSAEARGIIRANIETLGLTGATRVFRRDATALGALGPLEPFDLVFLDPPYGRGLGERALAAALAGGWLAPGAIGVLEERAGAAVPLPRGVTEIDRRVWGETEAVLFRVAAPAADSGAEPH